MSLTLPDPVYLQSLVLTLSLLIFSEYKAIHLGSALFKTGTSLSFFLGGWSRATGQPLHMGWGSAFSNNQGRQYALPMVIGLGFSVLGDILLIPPKRQYYAFRTASSAKRTSSGEGDSLAFKAGTLCFALAHISYIVAFAFDPKGAAFSWGRFGASVGVGLLVSRWLGIFGANSSTGGSKLTVPSDMEPLVKAYVCIISVMVGVATATDAGAQKTIGAWAFMISDMFVAVDTFGSSNPAGESGGGSRPRWGFRSVGWIFYFFANFILAGSI